MKRVSVRRATLSGKALFFPLFHRSFGLVAPGTARRASWEYLPRLALCDDA
jgi:hypothetical protein